MQTTTGTGFINNASTTVPRRCSRCGNEGYIGTNGLCPRCDDAVYGKKEGLIK